LRHGLVTRLPALAYDYKPGSGATYDSSGILGGEDEPQPPSL